MKIRVGIVGYGNLGKAVEQTLKEEGSFVLVGIFSKRSIPGTISVKEIENYKDKIDLLFLCGGSQNELEKQAFEMIKNFNIIESYDNHNRLKKYQKKLNIEAKKNGKIALCSFGWDPGLFSYMRGLFDAIGYKPYTFWGKGLSQGHTQAIKNLSGVQDAVQFTLPRKNILKRIFGGENVQPTKNFHKRLCYIVANKSSKERIKKEIVNMPDYFEGYKTRVKFVSQNKLDRLKSFKHQGCVITKKNTLNFSLKLPSNPEFTAKVVVCFARAYSYLKQRKNVGVFTIFDTPLCAVLKKEKYEFL